MPENRQPGKLAVILHADIAGSTSLVQQDEQLAHERIQDAFRRFTETIQTYQGHILELRGDALLAEFERPSDAVAATLAFQTDHTYLLSRLKDEIRPALRVGIAMGEVVKADNTVTGAGVVLAQRVEQLADPDGLCITAALHEALPKGMPFDLEDMGEHELKGFDHTARVFRVGLSVDKLIPPPELKHRPDPRIPRWSMVAIVAVADPAPAPWLEDPDALLLFTPAAVVVVVLMLSPWEDCLPFSPFALAAATTSCCGALLGASFGG